ncbi:hypothetical protein [Mesorhizobium sp. CAU 1741]|uniref:hypothetical protein n=1 Tax=Mesorhizobium sp. CAU 1741 TaxID=3140366 RepID=UPI00325ABD82
MPDLIDQVDVELCEDGRTVLFIGHTQHDDETFIASVTLPVPIHPDQFLAADWREVRNLHWRLH